MPEIAESHLESLYNGDEEREEEHSRRECQKIQRQHQRYIQQQVQQEAAGRMNAYICDAGVMDVLVEYIAEWPRYEEEWVGGIVIAETRGKAKHLFCRYENNHGAQMDFVDVKSVRLLLKDAAGPAGYIEHADPRSAKLWELVSLQAQEAEGE